MKSIPIGWIKQVDGSYSPPKKHENHRLSQSPVAKPAFCHDSLGAHEGKKSNTGRISVSIVSFRKRLLDPDNLAGGCKFILDCCRYEHLIPDDRAQDIILQTSQVKVTENERTEITIE